MSGGMLVGRVALITGAGRGIGRATSLLFASEGAEVVICSRTEKEILDVAREITAQGGRCLPVVADVSIPEDVQNLAARATETFGGVDILMNNAGITNEQPFMDFTLADWERIWQINVMSVVLCTRAVLPGMLERNRGCVINVASGAGLRGLPGNSAYSATKGAVVSLSQALGDEVKASAVSVNVICPGPIESEMLQQSRLRSFTTQQQVTLQPEDVAKTALFLASSLSSGMNSQVLVIRRGNRW